MVESSGPDPTMVCNISTASATGGPGAIFPGNGPVWWSIDVERNNDLSLGTDGAGLWRLRADDGKATPMLSGTGAPLVNSNAVYSIYTDKDGRRWVGTRFLRRDQRHRVAEKLPLPRI